jgi:hypothetical protein
MYLSDLQKGLQTAHLVAELASEYQSGEKALQFQNWAMDHKTIIICNGGNAAALHELTSFMTTPNNPFPYTSFQEDEQSLNNCITCVGIILPEVIYVAAESIRNNISSLEKVDTDQYWLTGRTDIGRGKFTSWEAQLIGRLNQMRLA